MKTFVINAYGSSVIFEDHWLAVIFDPYVICSRAGLLMICSPTAVTWFVPLMWVDAVNAFAGRALAHIKKKAHVIFAPLLAHSYPARSVVFIGFTVWVLAALEDLLPCLVNRGP